MFSSPLTADGVLGRLAHDLILADLPDLPPERRATAVGFCCDRVAGLPSPLLAGMTALVALVGAAARIAGRERVHARLATTSLPVVADLPRLVRSLAVAHVWEQWPGTSATGAPA